MIDSDSPWDVAALLGSRARVHRLADDGGQFGALSVVAALKPASSALIFLQHSTRLSRCARRNACCQAYALGGSRSVSVPFWQSQTLVHKLLAIVVGARLGRADEHASSVRLRAPFEFPVAEHATVALDATAFDTASTLGLWRSNLAAQLESVRELLDAASIWARNVALEAMMGFVVAWLNTKPVRGVGSAANASSDGRASRQAATVLSVSPRCCSAQSWIRKEHGASHNKRGCRGRPNASATVG